MFTSILFTTLCLKKQRSSNIFSMRQLRRNVTNRPAAENARSASKLNVGIDLYLAAICQLRQLQKKFCFEQNAFNKESAFQF